MGYKWINLNIRCRCPRHLKMGSLYARIKGNKAYLYVRHGKHFCYVKSVDRDIIERKLELYNVVSSLGKLVEVKVLLPEELINKINESGYDVSDIVLKMVKLYLDKYSVIDNAFSG